MIKKKTIQCLLIVSILILVLAIPLILSVTGILLAANPNMVTINSKSPGFNQMKLVREGTVYTSTDSVNYVRGGYINSDANLELIVYSNETAYYKVTVVDGKSLTEQWSFQSTYTFDQIIPDNIDLDPQDELISVVQDTITVYDNNGTALWTKDYGEPLVATVISDQNSDGAKDLLIFSTTVYGAYYWKYWIENGKNATTIDSGNLDLPDSIYPDKVLAIDWDLTSTGDEIVSFDEVNDYYTIVFINKNASGDLVFNKSSDLHDGWTEIDTIISGDRYISFYDCDYDGIEFDYRVVTIDTVAYTHWTCSIVGPLWYLRFIEIDGDSAPELFVDSFTGLLTFDIESGTPLQNLSAPYPIALPLDLDIDGIDECIIYFDYSSPSGWDRLLDSKTLNRIADVTPPSTLVIFFGYYQRDSEVVLVGIEYTNTYPYTPNTVAIYSLKPDTTLLLFSYMVLSLSQQAQPSLPILMLLGGVAAVAIISSAVILWMRGRAVPSPPEPGPGTSEEWKPN